MNKEQAIPILREIACYHAKDYYAQLHDVEELIEQQAEQIKDMRNCDNCMKGSFIEECYICVDPGVGFNYDRGWKWDGGSDGN